MVRAELGKLCVFAWFLLTRRPNVVCSMLRSSDEWHVGFRNVLSYNTL